MNTAITLENSNHIEKSVGKKGANKPLDVIFIQNMLNHCRVSYSGKKLLAADGKCGPATIDQIKFFQEHVVKLNNPDCRVDPQGRTLSLLLSSVKSSYFAQQVLSSAFHSKSNVNILRYINLFRAQYPSASNINYLERLAKSIYLDSTITDVRWMAYMLATVHWECAGTWKPIEEFGKGKQYPYGKEIEVINPQTQKTSKNIYYGRGYVQLTWADNYRKLGKELGIGDELYLFPEKALEHDISYKILSLGMRKGLFSEGNFLARYINGNQNDFIGARRIINGVDKKEKIANLAEIHLRLLNAATVSRDYNHINPINFRNYA